MVSMVRDRAEPYRAFGSGVLHRYRESELFGLPPPLT